MKKLLIGLLAATLTISMVACTKPAETEPKEPVGDASQTEVQEPSEEAPEEPSQAESKEEEKTYGIGDTVTIDDVVVTLNGVTHPDGSDLLPPEDGKIFALIEFNIENNSAEELAVSSLLNFKCHVDDYSTSLSLGALAAKEGVEQLDGSVSAGKKIKGVVGYEIPEDWKEISIAYEPGLFGSKEAAFVIINE